MTPAEFETSLRDSDPPPDCDDALKALWYAGKNDWRRAHEIAQRADDMASAWVHAYLHRVEGDLGNAAYWYRRAGREPATGPLEAEWRKIAEQLLTSPDTVAP